MAMPLSLVVAVGLALGAQAPSQGEIIDRILAIVGGQVVTLSDARAAVVLGLLDIGASTGVPAVTDRLVERELILREVQRYAPPEPASAAIDARMGELRRRFAGTGGFERAIDANGFTERRLRAWVRDDLRVQAYLAQRFATAGAPTDQEIAGAYARQLAEFEERGMSLEAATPMLRERLAAARRVELIAEWVADLRRRTEVVLIP